MSSSSSSLSPVNFLRVQSDLFKLIGFDLFPKGDPWQQYYRALPSVLALAFIAPFITAAVVHNLTRVDVVCDALCALLITLLGLFKYGMIVHLRGDFINLVNRFLRMINDEFRKADGYRHVIEEENRREQFISRLFRNTWLFAWVLCSLVPYVSMAVTYKQNGKFEPFLPYPCDFPWELHSIRNYILSYFWSICAGMGVVLPAVSIDTLFCGFTHNLCAFFKIAQKKIVTYRRDTLKETEDNLKEIFKLYQECLDMCVRLNKCFEPLICAQFFISSLQICVVGYLFSVNFNKPQGMYNAAYLISMIIQAYCYCYCGEYLSTESTNFAWAIYDSPWYEAGSTVGISRSMRISIMRAQRGCRITGYFFVANMEAFSAIVRTAMSYITMLRSFS